MSLAVALNLLMQVFFIALGVLTLVDYARHRDGIRRDVALLFGFLAVPFLVQLVAAIQGDVVSEGANNLAILALVFEPILLLRVARHLRSMPGSILRIATGGLLATCFVGIFFGSQIPLLSLVVSQTYLIGLNLYAAIAFVRGALNATGISRKRLRCAAAGSGLLALTLLVVLVAPMVPEQQREAVYLIAEVLAIASANAFYIGFIPPRWLRRNWQLIELRYHLLGATGHAPAEAVGVSESLKQLCRSATQAVGGLAAGAVQSNEGASGFTLREATDFDLLGRALASGAPIIEKASREETGSFVYVPEIRDEDERKPFQALGAGTWLLVPMVVNRRLWGVLLVLLRGRSLFVDDDLTVLQLLAQESAIVLTNYGLIAALRNYSEDLEHEVAERTAALSESEQRYRELAAELEQRVSDRTVQLESANKELEAFTYSVSHDLRAPLRAIDGFSRILVEDYGPDLSDEAQQYLDKVRTNTLRMGQLIDDLLKFSHVNRQVLKKQTVDLTALVNEVLADLRAEQDGRQIELVIEDLPSIEGDRALLKQAFVNLLSNALKYTRKREHPLIEIRCRSDKGERIYSVKDNGAGFDMRYAQKLFGVFERLHSAAEFEGTGVGLAIVQRIIDRHGGRIWAEAEVDRGATFFFTLEGEPLPVD